MSKIGYLFDRFGVFSGEISLQKNPREPGRYLVPKNATTSRPPVEKFGEVAVFENGGWRLVPDVRGEVWYTKDGTPVEITTPGDPVEAGFFERPPQKEE